MRHDLPADERRLQEAAAQLFPKANPVAGPNPRRAFVPSGVDPGTEYLDWMIEALRERDVDIKVTPAGKAVFCGATGRLTAEIRGALSACKPYFLARLRERFPEYPWPTLPEPGRVVEWVGPDYPADPNNCGRAVRDGLAGIEWARWRYEGHPLWHAATGETWEE